MKIFKKQKSFILCLAHPVLWVGPNSEFCILADPPTEVFKGNSSKETFLGQCHSNLTLTLVDIITNTLKFYLRPLLFDQMSGKAESYVYTHFTSKVSIFQYQSPIAEESKTTSLVTIERRDKKHPGASV